MNFEQQVTALWVVVLRQQALLSAMEEVLTLHLSNQLHGTRLRDALAPQMKKEMQRALATIADSDPAFASLVATALAQADQAAEDPNT